METRALRDVRLRRHDAVVVLLFIGPTLNDETPSPVKVNATAEGLGMERRTVRRALQLLVSLGYLIRLAPPTAIGRAPGTYLLPAMRPEKTVLAA